MQTSSTCPACGGEGQIITQKCVHCHGNGVVKAEDIVEINIPAGVSEGMQLSVSGKGNAAARGGIPGDLIVVIEEIPHQDLERDNQNLLYEHYLNFADAALGTSISIPTLEGKAKIKIPAGTQSGKVFRLKGKGLPSINSYGRGDLLVNVNVWTPKQLSEKGIFNRMKEYFH
jgi:molecular chaperone DnaJ